MHCLRAAVALVAVMTFSLTALVRRLGPLRLEQSGGRGAAWRRPRSLLMRGSMIR